MDWKSIHVVLPAPAPVFCVCVCVCVCAYKDEEGRTRKVVIVLHRVAVKQVDIVLFGQRKTTHELPRVHQNNERKKNDYGEGGG